MMMGREIMEKRRYTLKALADKMLGAKQLQEQKIHLHDAEHDVLITATLFAWLHEHGYKH